jgi:hypothetical protein
MSEIPQLEVYRLGSETFSRRISSLDAIRKETVHTWFN